MVTLVIGHNCRPRQLLAYCHYVIPLKNRRVACLVYLNLIGWTDKGVAMVNELCLIAQQRLSCLRSHIASHSAVLPSQCKVLL